MKRAKLRILAATLALGVFAGMSLGSSSTKEEPTKVGEVNADADNTDAKEGDEKDTAETSSAQTEYRVGDILQTSDFKIVYVASGEYEEANEFLKPDEGKKYVYIKLYVENTTSDDHNISYYDFDGFADGYAVDMYYGAEPELSATLSPGRTTTGVIAFEVSNDTESVEIEYEYDFFNDGRVTFIYEGEKDSGFIPENNTSASENAYKVGDILETSDLKITYLSSSEYNSDNQFIQPADGYKFIMFELEFENISNDDQSVSSYSFDCFADGASCEQHFFMDESLDATISAGRKTSGIVVFEVPVDATTIELEYVDGWISGNRIVFAYAG